MRELKRVTITIDAEGVRPRSVEAVMTTREANSLAKKIDTAIEDACAKRNAELGDLEARIAELRGGTSGVN